ncbi:MAG: ABC-2 transporter permease [Clostridia bacterium]|nr:ABC-2 transporter permease [Clostridia bacterium]
MKGLLYKDFLLMKGKLILTALAAVLLLILVFRFAVAGVKLEFTVENMEDVTGVLKSGVDAGNNALSVSLQLIDVSVIILMIMTVPYLISYIFTRDEKTNNGNYLLSLPVSKKQYVASKYILVLIMHYIFYSVSQLILIIDMSRENASSKIADTVQTILLPLFLVSMLIAVFELPVMISQGVEKAKQKWSYIFIAIFMLIIPAVLFVNPDFIARADPIGFVIRHQSVLVYAQLIGVAVVAAASIISYRYSLNHCEIRERGVWKDD